MKSTSARQHATGATSSDFDNGRCVHALLQQRSAEALARAEAARQHQQPQQLFLPGLDEHLRAMPNYLSRSPIFAPTALKRICDGTVLYQKETAMLKGWGKQLTEDHADIWLHAIFLASKLPLGTPVIINRAQFLRALGRNTSGASYDWLHRGVIALSTFTIAIEVRAKDGKTKYSIGCNPTSRVIQMLGGFDYNGELEEYRLVLDPRWRQIFSNREYGFLDWEKRLRIGRGQDLAKSLQRLISTSADTIQRHSLESLMGRALYTSPVRKFRGAVSRAMEELERCEIIAGGRIEHSSKGKEQAVWTRL